MKSINPKIILETEVDGIQLLKNIERFGRVCYKSEDLITESSSRSFVKNILKSGHESVIEHFPISVRVICDRGVSHEIVRHRIASYSQESTRYCNYSMDKFESSITYIEPCFFKKGSEQYSIWENTMKNIEKAYFELLSLGATPQEARSVLPNSLKTEIVMTMNLREWRHFLKLRTSRAAHPQMREIANSILSLFLTIVPIIFDEILEAEQV